MRRGAAHAAHAALALALAAGCGSAFGGGSVALQAGVMWPGVFPGHPFMGPLPLYAGACGFQANCLPPWWDERRQRARPMPPAPQPLADSDIWGGAGSPWGYVRRLPPPTPESQIQPQFRDASTIRPEFLER